VFASAPPTDPKFCSSSESAPYVFDSAGTIYVPDNGSGELRIFSRDGMFIRKIGRRGNGPGEFQQISNVIPYGQHIAVIDGGLRRTNELSSDGTLAASTWGASDFAARTRADSVWVGIVGSLPVSWP
jgi:hypothetical protein